MLSFLSKVLRKIVMRRSLILNKQKILLSAASSAYKHSLKEVMASQGIASQIKVSCFYTGCICLSCMPIGLWHIAWYTLVGACAGCICISCTSFLYSVLRKRHKCPKVAETYCVFLLLKPCMALVSTVR